MTETGGERSERDPELSPQEVARLTSLVRQALRSDGEAPLAREPPEFEGQSFGRFERLSAVGTGGFGCVYKAHDPVLARDVALKIPHRPVVLDDDALRRFRIEAEAAA